MDQLVALHIDVYEKLWELDAAVRFGACLVPWWGPLLIEGIAQMDSPTDRINLNTPQSTDRPSQTTINHYQVTDMNSREPRPMVLESFANLMTEVEGRMSTVVVRCHI